MSTEEPGNLDTAKQEADAQRDVARNEAGNPTQRVATRTCATCASPVEKPRSGPTSARCTSCRRAAMTIQQATYYLRSARKLAVRIGRTDLAAAITAVLAERVETTR